MLGKLYKNDLLLLVSLLLATIFNQCHSQSSSLFNDFDDDNIDEELFDLPLDDSYSNSRSQVYSKVQTQSSESAQGGSTDFVSDWPTKSIVKHLGGVSGVAIDKIGDIYLFQRANNSWKDGDFDKKNVYTRRNQKPISEPTILKFSSDLSRKAPLSQFGQNEFYLPHGITVDHEGNIWVTDVARHQVLKYKPNSSKPSLILGEKFVPGSDLKHFCKPTHVAVDSQTGDFFVADGYCNSRIIKFNKSGKVIKSWGKEDKDGVANDIIRGNDYELSVPHYLALLEDKDEICVADREHARVQCFIAGLTADTKHLVGKLVRSIDASAIGPTFAITYSPTENILAILGGVRGEVTQSNVGIYHLGSESFVDEIYPPGLHGFGEGHALAFCPKGKRLLVSSIEKVCSENKPEVREEVHELEMVAESGKDPIVDELEDIKNSPCVKRNVWLFQVEK